MKIKLLTISKSSFPFVISGIDMFSSRLKNYSKFELDEIILPKKYNKLDPLHLKREEAKAILKKLSDKDLVILLDEKGKELNSRKFSTWLEQKLNLSSRTLVFVIGGAFGFDEEIYKRADGKISLSQMTFSHQLIRVIFLEQLYRAFTILRNEKYHND